MKALSQVSPSENDDTAVIAYHGASSKSPVSILIIYYSVPFVWRLILDISQQYIYFLLSQAKENVILFSQVKINPLV